jgi:hypothetical protein
LIGYAPNGYGVSNALQGALLDPDEGVRAIVIRWVPLLTGIHIPAQKLVTLLHSDVLSDRTESVKALLALSDRGEPGVNEQVREGALPELAEMARWKTPEYARPAFLLLGRAEGLPDDKVRQAWEQDPESVIAKALH